MVEARTFLVPRVSVDAYACIKPRFPHSSGTVSDLCRRLPRRASRTASQTLVSRYMCRADKSLRYM